MDRVLAAVGRGHTLDAALASEGLALHDWEREVRADDGLIGRLAAARRRAAFRKEERLLRVIESGGAAAAKAQEELDALGRLDWGAQTSRDLGPIERVVSEPRLMAEMPAHLAARLGAALAERRALERDLKEWLSSSGA